MTVTAPPRPPRPGDPVTHDEPEALIEEARRRARLRRIGIAAFVLAALAGTAIFLGVRGGGHSAQPQDESSAVPNARSAPPQSGASGLVALTRVDAGQSHMMLIDPSGRSRPRDLGPGWGPSWSPDGRKLAFTYEVTVGALIGRGLNGGLERIFVMNADGSGRHLLPVPSPAPSRFEDWAPAWSPDGSRIMFARTVWSAGTPHYGSRLCCSARSTVNVLDLAHGGLRGLRRVSTMRFYGESGYATWSPDGRRLAYIAPASECSVLHITNADGTGDHVLAAASRSPGAPNGCAPVVTPAWSPDGQWIAFTRATDWNIYLISPNGTHLHRLTDHAHLANGAPTWSRDGQRIAFGVGRLSDVGELEPPYGLAVIDRDGSHRHTILNVRGSLYGSGPAWQPR